MNHAIVVRRLAVLLVLAAAASAGSVAAQVEGAGPNTLGLYRTEHPTTVCDICGTQDSGYTGTPGTITVYAVLLDPRNLDLDAPMVQVSGFAFRLELPPSIYLLDAAFASGTPCATGPDFVVQDAALVVSGGACTLATLTLGAFTGQQAYIFLAATGAGACRPGALDVTDAVPPGSTHPVTPSSGALDLPIYGVFPNCGLPAESDAWGAVKALYR